MSRTATDPALIAELLAEAYDISGELMPLAGHGENYLVTCGDGSRYVLKLCDDEQTPEFLALEHAAAKAINSAAPGFLAPETVLTAAGAGAAEHSVGPDMLRARLLQFIDGDSWNSSAATAARRTDLGRCLAAMADALAGVTASVAHRTHRWDLTAASALRAGVSKIKDPRQQALLDQAFLIYEAGAATRFGELPRGLIHGDMNDENILIAGEKVVGVLDFGDAVHNPIVCELAIALSYALLDETQPLAAGAEIIASYHQAHELSVAEAEVLFPLICGRLAVSLVIAADHRTIDPDREAWFATEARAWALIERLVDIDPIFATEALVAGTDLLVFADRSTPRDEALARRKRHFCDALSLTYEEPIAFSRGRMQFLMDDRERPFLDMYNNVCHVGHCHPRVVAAGARQMARLNTNSRYILDRMAEYAERLRETMSPTLTHCLFVNSGSEANEMALRLARAHTGREDLLVVDGAYHGHTHTLTKISPYKFMGPGGSGVAEDWVHVIPLADGFRGAHKGQSEETGRAYADEVSEIIEAMPRPPGALITESLLSCGGQVVPPEGYLASVFEHVRAAGGVCIADEVQVGFGRVGACYWGYELSGVIPDIVVLGKPIGNGHPMGAVVTTAEIAQSLADAGMEVFSTFGGNPVSCEIGMAVMDVVQEEYLQENALRVGTMLRAGLVDLMDRHELIGDVRGIGLFIGIELVEDRATLVPAVAATAALVNGLRQRHILTGIDGPLNNVVKIKPPLVVTEADAEMTIRAVDEVLSQIGRS
jgi:4-aminobutyrate aminotransferase-like enzyme/Ser/Thr protein kinase RdoA (MazF antagonist)